MLTDALTNIKRRLERMGTATPSSSVEDPKSNPSSDPEKPRPRRQVWLEGGVIHPSLTWGIFGELNTLLGTASIHIPGALSYQALYSSIERGKFRLLKLSLDTERPAIPACHLREKEIGTENFVAVSYTWISEEYKWYGERLPRKTYLRIDGKVFRVRPRIVLIVSMLFAVGIRNIWIDAICINQADQVEKGHQVARMDQIFSAASEVVMFLGKPTLDTDVALGQFQTRHMRDFGWPGWDGMQQIVRHEYWQRAWILQEIAGDTKKRRLFCGNRMLTSEDTHELIREFHSAYHPKLAQERSYLRSVSRVALTQEHSLLPLLASTRDAKCGDVRDAIYAKIRLAKGGQALLGEPDYTESPANLFLRFARANIEEHRSLEILRYVQNHQLSGLPSWVPDWTPQRDVSTWNFNSFTYTGEWLALLSADEEDFDATFQEDPPALHVRGRLLTQMLSADELQAKASVHVQHGKGVNVDTFCEDLQGEYFMWSLIGLDVPVILAREGDGYVYLNKDRSSPAARFWMQMAVNRVKKRVDTLRLEPLEWIKII